MTVLNRYHVGCLVLFAVLLAAACDHGFVPPEGPQIGTIQADITYIGAWPDEADVHDLRLVAMRFVPKDTADFLQLNRMAISRPLMYGLLHERVVIPEVETGAFVYSGIAQQFDSNLLSWRPVGLYTDNFGLFFVTPQDTAFIAITVDFDHLPIFPPPDL